MTAAAITHQNHYVPIWYQKGFIYGPRKTLYFLDLDPKKTTLPDGRIIVAKDISSRAPKSCFWSEDLYTTRFGGHINDEVERFLFGAIDNNGAQAVRAFASNELQSMHRLFQHFFEYMNAQKLRTPKGLDWIKSKYPKLNQLDLMIEMQHLRQMDCTMWSEGVREIVSAEKSDVKFVVSDHPVTTYNRMRPPSSAACLYPDDPSIALKGTQTLFALDAEHCLILTNLEYAKNPDAIDLLAPRQNARFFGQTLTRTDAMIRTRFLTSGEVSSINQVIKARARRYVAAYEKDWLHSEAGNHDAWQSVAETLLPRDELWHFGGEIYVGYKDGSTQHQDAFGRTSSAHEFLKKKETPTKLEPNDPCGCDSGRKYKKCCDGIALEDRQPWDVFSIRERNLILCRAAIDILDLNKDKTWEDVQRELSDAQVKRIHETLEFLWPADTNIADLLPRPDKRVFRTVYLGLVDPRTIAVSVTSWLAYFDEIIIVHPFPNPSYMRPEFSPTHSPAKHKSQTLKNVSLLLSLMPLIEAGLIHLVPDPMEFNAEFRQRIMAMAKARGAGLKLDKTDMEVGMALGKDDFRRAILRQPEDQLRRQIEKSQPKITPELLEGTIKHMKESLRSDPLALLQPINPGKAGGELQLLRGMSLELAMFFAQLTGAAIYTDSIGQWKQMPGHETGVATCSTSWTPLADGARRLGLTTEANPLVNLELRQAGQLGHTRKVLCRIWRSIVEGVESEPRKTAEKLANKLENAVQRGESEWAACVTKIAPSQRWHRKVEFSLPEGGFSLTTVQRLLLTFGRANHLESVPLAILIRPDDVA